MTSNIIGISACTSTRFRFETYKETKRAFSNIINWYNYFTRDRKNICYSFLPDSLQISDINEKYLSEQQLKSHYQSKNQNIENFIEYIHKKEAQQTKRDLLVLYKKMPSRELERFIESTEYYYFNFSQPNPDSLDSKIKAKYDSLYESEANVDSIFNSDDNIIEYNLAANIIDTIEFKTNSIGYSIDSILFSKKYNVSNFFEIPKSLLKYVNEIFQFEKQKLIQLGDSTFYNRIAYFKLSFKLNSTSTLWFSTNVSDSTIYISPRILRAIFIASFNTYDLNLLYRKQKKYLSEKEQYHSRTKYRSWNDLISAVATFDTRFIGNISFVLQHEMAHVYLSKNGIVEKNETKCDCYALANFKMRDLSSLWYDGLGIYNSLLKSAIYNNRAELWGIKNIDLIVKRFKIIDSLSRIKVTANICESNFNE